MALSSGPVDVALLRSTMRSAIGYGREDDSFALASIEPGWISFVTLALDHQVAGLVFTALRRLPPGSVPLPVFDIVLSGITVRGSIVGTRLDLQEALDFASAGKVKARVSTDKLENINRVFERMRRGEIEGRVVLDLAA